MSHFSQYQFNANSTDILNCRTFYRDFAGIKILNPVPSSAAQLTFSRASTATYVDVDGLVKTATSGTPRWHHTPTTGICRGLMIEETRTNLFLQSEDFSSSSWSKANTTVTANATTAPDGLVTADKLIATTDSGGHLLATNPSIAVTSGNTYTSSCFAKAGEYPALCLVLSGGFAANTFASFDLVNNLSQVSGAAGATVGMESYPNGWKRCWLTLTATSTTTASPQIRGVDQYVLGDRSFTGDNTSGIFIWGAQFEIGSAPSSYIPTTTVAVARAQEQCTVTGTEFAKLGWSPAEGTMFADFTSSGTTGAKFTTFGFVNYTANFGVGISDGSSSGANYYTEGFASQAVVNTTLNSANRRIWAFTTNDFAYASNANTTISTDNSGAMTLGTPLHLAIGFNTVPSQGALGVISSVAYYNKRLPNQILSALVRTPTL